MRNQDIPVNRAKELRSAGHRWKAVADTLIAEGYPAFQPRNISRACKRLNPRCNNPTFFVNIPLKTIGELRRAGFMWKDIPSLLVAKGYPRWNYSTLCGAFKGSKYDLSR